MKHDGGAPTPKGRPPSSYLVTRAHTTALHNPIVSMAYKTPPHRRRTHRRTRNFNDLRATTAGRRRGDSATMPSNN